MTFRLHSRRIYTEDGPVDGVLTVTDGRITDIAPHADAADAIDYGDLRVIPGIFDTHNHGAGGYDPMDTAGTPEQRAANVRGYLKVLASYGTVNVFPTVVEPVSIRTVAEVAAEGPADGAQILGIHSEGPWLNRVGEKGIHTGWPEVSMQTARDMVEAGGGLLRLVAIAPEIPGVDPIIEYFLSQGITVAAAHSDNNYRQAMAAYGRGITVSTHTGNVMTGMHHRDVGGLGAALLNDQVDCEVICDGLHICNEMLSIYFRIKDPDKFMMVSDGTPMTGAPVGRYSGFFQGIEVNVRPDGFVLSDTGRLMGSSQPVLFGIGNLVENVGLPLETCLRMACYNPARKYGFAKQKGSIAVGKDADLVVISDDYQAQATYACGRKVYDRALEGNVANTRYFEEKKL